MINKIELKFDKATTRLAGNPYGKSVYKEQVEKKIDFSKKNVLVFPETIEKVASSFTQGLFDEIIKQIGFSGVREGIQIKAKDETIEKAIFDDLFY